MILVNLSY